MNPQLPSDATIHQMMRSWARGVPLPSDATLHQSIIHPAPPNLSPEATYRYYERLGMTCGTADPTPKQLRDALLEAREYDLNHD